MLLAHGLLVRVFSVVALPGVAVTPAVEKAVLAYAKALRARFILVDAHNWLPHEPSDWERTANAVMQTRGVLDELLLREGAPPRVVRKRPGKAPCKRCKGTKRVQVQDIVGQPYEEWCPACPDPAPTRKKVKR